MGHSSWPRLFAALDPGEEVAGALARWARGALRRGGEREARVLAPESLHVTLMFLGERPLHELGPLAEALARGAQDSGPVEIETGAPVWLPPRRPRALAVEVRDRDGGLDRLQRGVAAALCDVAGLAVPRRFRAHLTVARARSAPVARELLQPTPALRFLAGEVLLYRSHLESRAARYEQIAAVSLTG